MVGLVFSSLLYNLDVGSALVFTILPNLGKKSAGLSQ